MKLVHSDIIDGPVEEIYALVRDKLPDIVAYLPSIDKIEKLESSSLESGELRIVNLWFAKVEMPGLIRKFLSKDLFSWKDSATWDNSKLQVNYELESFIANDLFEAKGFNTFISTDDGKTKLTVTCDLEIHPEKLPGVPKIMMKKVQPLLEKLIEKMLQPNLTSLGEGLKAYLASQ